MEIKKSFENRFLEMLKSKEVYENFIKIIKTPQRKSFRINQNLDVLEIKKKIEKKGVKLEKIPFCDFGFYVNYEDNNRFDLGNLFEHFKGEIYIQEATSMLPVLALTRPKKIDDNFLALDLCAAPGSKTTQLCDFLNGVGTIIANESDYKRLSSLKHNIERLNYSNVIITNSLGQFLTDKKEIFDIILCDVPCSGSGVIRKSPKTLLTYNPKRLKQITKLQKKILEKAFSMLKQKGQLIYSTCSLDPEENEILIMNFLEENKTAKLEKIEIKNLILTNKIKEFLGVKISKEVYEKTIRVWPQDNNTNGFFLAKIVKISI